MNKKQIIFALVILFLSFATLYAEEGSGKSNKPASSTLTPEEKINKIVDAFPRLWGEGGVNKLSKSASLTLSQKKAIKKIVDEDFGLGPDIKEVDLNKDGQKEVIVIYDRLPHHSHVTVIKFTGDKPNILFEKDSNAGNIVFKIIKKIPTLIIEESDYVPDFATGKLHKNIYEWDGKTFSIKK